MEKMPNPEDTTNLQKKRVLHDAEMLKNGAEFIITENGDLVLDATEKQINKAHYEMENDLRIKNSNEKYNDYIGKVVIIKFKNPIRPWKEEEKKDLSRLIPIYGGLKWIYDSFKEFDEIKGKFLVNKLGYLTIQYEKNKIHISDENIADIEIVEK